MTDNNESVNEVELTEYQKTFLELAFKYAHEALAKLEVPVGCIFIYNEQIIAKGRNEVNETRNATRHAEMVCIDQVIDYCNDKKLDYKEVFKGVDVFVTVEPCIMCVAALYELSVRAVIFGCKNFRFGGETVLNVASIMKPTTKFFGGYRADEAMELLKEFYKGVNPNAPPSKVKTKNKVQRVHDKSVDTL